MAPTQTDADALLPPAAEAALVGRFGTTLRLLALAGAGACAVAAATAVMGRSPAGASTGNERESIGLPSWDSATPPQDTPRNVALWWYQQGQAGGVNIGGIRFEPNECYIHAVKLDDKNKDAWAALGKLGGGVVTVGGAPKAYHPNDCYVKAVESGGAAKDWLLLAGVCKDDANCGTVDNVVVSKKQCYEKALKDTSLSETPKLAAAAWLGCGQQKCDVVPALTPAECFRKSIQLDKSVGDAWYGLGMALQQVDHVEFDGTMYGRKECFSMAVLLTQQKNPDYWFQFCKAGAGKLLVAELTKADCFARVLGLKADHAEAWQQLSVELAGGKEHEVSGLGKWNERQCHNRAVELDQKFADTVTEKWFLGALEAAKSPNHKFSEGANSYTECQCYEKQLTASPEHALSYLHMGQMLLPGAKCKVNSVEHTSAMAYSAAVCRDPKLFAAWEALAGTGTTVSVCEGNNKKDYTVMQCWTQAIEAMPSRRGPWCSLAKSMKDDETLTILNQARSKSYVSTQCSG